ncbi:MAG: CHAT domain-containing protein [Saprospirales bacterium]|nr:MAG: CHAT domain-containing protein [Saprospirales bacterium]
MPTIKIPGIQSKTNLRSTLLKDILPVEDTYEIQDTIRGATHIESSSIDEETIIYYEYEDGSSVFLSYDELCLLSVEEQKLIKGSRNESEFKKDDLLLPLSIPDPDGERGLFSRILPKVIGILKKKTTDEVLSGLADKTTLAIANHLQSRLVNEEGLFSVDENFIPRALPGSFAKDKPYFLFIHGTNSNTYNAFSGLKNEHNGQVWNEIKQKYDGRVLAFEHHTMTKSPLENILKLATDLPDEISTVIMTHSRGGLVMDTLLMALECSKDDEQRQLVSDFFKKYKREKDAEIFQQIMDALNGKKIKVEQSIKVACPGYGTHLLSDNLTNFTRVLSALVKYAVPAASQTIGTIVEKLVLSIIKNKDEVNVLPGLEVMTPDSPFLKIINGFEKSLEHSQFIMAGRASLTSNIVHSLKFIFTRIIIQERSDMVVHTRSMHQGLKNPGGYKYFLAEGRTVHHSSYFVDDFTQEKIIYAIESGGKTIPGTVEVSLNEAPETRGLLGIEHGEIRPKKISGTKPVIILLPGILGSTLYKREKRNARYWLSYSRIVRGHLSRLGIHEKNISPEGAIRTAYKRFCDYFERQGYEVYLHPYDWRKSLNESAENLNRAIKEDLLDEYPELTVQVVSHSMGGVLFRTFVNNHKETYDQLRERNRFRWIMAGTPWYGSYAALETLLGQGSKINLLASISIGLNKHQLLEIFIQYPGLLELLPLNINNGITDRQLTSIEFWEDLNKKDKNGSAWVIPSDKNLNQLKAYFEQVQSFSLKNPDNVYYIAGGGGKKGKRTPINYSIENGIVKFDQKTRKGDTTVSWKEGIPEELIEKNNVYYVRTTHGQLLNDPNLFPGIRDLLLTGSAPFSTVGSAIIRGGEEILQPIYDESIDFVNNEFELEELLFDFDEDLEFMQTPLIDVKISHGHLKYAEGPLMVGHFTGEYIIKAQGALDNALGGLLKERFEKGVYPETAGSSLFILRPEGNKPRGALIIGNGNPFEFTGFKLTTAVRSGIVSAILQIRDNHYQGMGEVYMPDTISSLLVGTAYGGISMENSIRSIVEGVKLANRDLQSESESSYYENTIKNIEFVELYEDKAIAAFYILKRLHRDGIIRNTQLVIDQKSGAKTNLSITYGSDNWNQLTIRQASPCPMALDNCVSNRNRLTFSLNTGMAREDSKDVYFNTTLIHHYLREIAKEDQRLKNWDQQTAKVLFERLIPQDFKNNLRLQQNTILNLDLASSVFPWELIQDTAVNEKPWCVSTGLIRQLNLSRPVSNRKYSNGNHILVIGDPVLNSDKFAQLPGAAREAEEVQNLFRARNYDLDVLINRDATEVFSSIFAREHRFIHIAAHGVFDPNDSLKSGIIIGSEKNDDKEELMLITAADILQLDTLPEMVFINTCYSGKNTSAASDHSYRTYEFAANIGHEFISRGVRSVIIAGWPVYDDLALLFAKTFYQAMFKGDEFGVAVQKARSRCYEAAPDRNTWGAYQCYGDSMYRMTSERSGYENNSSAREYLLPQEVYNDLKNLISRAGNSKNKVNWLKPELQALSTAVARLQIRDPEILEQEAFAYYHLGDNNRALRILENLLKTEKASYDVRTLEQWCNIKAKDLVIRAEESNKGENGKLSKSEKNAIEKEFDEIIEKLESLQKFGETSERYSLLGSCMKRKAMSQHLMERPKNTIKANLRKSLNYYSKAKDKNSAMYDLYNEIVILQLQIILNTDENHRENFSKLLKNFNKPRVGEDYYQQIQVFNILVTEFLLSGKIVKAGKTPPEKFLIAQFEEIWKDYGSYNQLKGEYEHLENLIAGLNKNDARIKVLGAVAEHIRYIEQANN